MTHNFELRREKHAIGQFDAAITFGGNLTAAQFATVQNALINTAESLQLPAPMNLQVFNIAIGNPVAPPPPDGKGFQRFSPAGEVVESIFCDANQIRYALREYENWATTREKIAKAFLDLVRQYTKFIPVVSSLSLQYLNEFRSKAVEPKSVAEIFYRNSKWIAPHLLDSNQPWHCHTGQFIPTDAPFRHLVNVNCDCSHAPWPETSETKTFAKALILAANQYDLPEHGPLILSETTPNSLILENFDRAHLLEKRILNEVISPEYIEIMGDGAGDH